MEGGTASALLRVVTGLVAAHPPLLILFDTDSFAHKP